MDQDHCADKEKRLTTTGTRQTGNDWRNRSRLGRIEIGAQAFLAGLLRRVGEEEFGRGSAPRSSDDSRSGRWCDRCLRKVAADAHVGAFDALLLANLDVAVDRYLRALIARFSDLMMD
jgi:hypothetical protein